MKVRLRSVVSMRIAGLDDRLQEVEPMSRRQKAQRSPTVTRRAAPSGRFMSVLWERLELMSVLLVQNHVERTVPASKFRDRRTSFLERPSPVYPASYPANVKRTYGRRTESLARDHQGRREERLILTSGPFVQPTKF